MKYELWDVVSYGDGEPPMPFTLIERTNTFSEIYTKFVQENKNRSCVIFLKEEKEETFNIHTSPDGGTTVYERNFGYYNNKNKRKIKG
jgi:hypothetical protein